MDKKQRSALRRFRRVEEYLTRNAVSGTQVKLRQLTDVIRQMTSRGEEQDANNRVVKGETARQTALREALRNQHMVPISRGLTDASQRRGSLASRLPREMSSR